MVLPGSYPRRPAHAKYSFRDILLILMMLRGSSNAYVSVSPPSAMRRCNPPSCSSSSSISRNLWKNQVFRRHRDTAVSYPNTANCSSRLKASAAHTPSNHTTNSSENSSAAAPSLKRYHDLSNRVDRVVCLSDLHTDHVDNLQWLRRRLNSSSSSSAPAAKTTKLTKRDLVIVAGDISNDVPTFCESLDLLLEHCQVLFVPGNHEAWLSHKERQLQGVSSLDKLDFLYQLCRERGAYVDPIYIAGDKERAVPPLWILPLESWYDGTLSFDEELCHGFGE